MSMKEKIKKELTESKDFYAVLLICGILTILFLVFQENLIGEDSVFNDNISDIPILNTIYHYIPLVLECIVIGFVAFVLIKVVQFVIEKLFSHSKGHRASAIACGRLARIACCNRP